MTDVLYMESIISMKRKQNRNSDMVSAGYRSNLFFSSLIMCSLRQSCCRFFFWIWLLFCFGWLLFWSSSMHWFFFVAVSCFWVGFMAFEKERELLCSIYWEKLSFMGIWIWNVFERERNVWSSQWTSKAPTEKVALDT